MKPTHHALKRCQQRGIPIPIIDLITGIGEAVPASGGALRLRISKSEKSALLGELKRIIHMVEKASTTHLIVSRDGIVMTAYHRQ